MPHVTPNHLRTIINKQASCFHVVLISTLLTLVLIREHLVHYLYRPFDYVPVQKLSPCPEISCHTTHSATRVLLHGSLAVARRHK